jgi:hypothetical protein
MKLTAKKLVSLAFAAAVASAISGMPLEASAEPIKFINANSQLSIVGSPKTQDKISAHVLGNPSSIPYESRFVIVTRTVYATDHPTLGTPTCTITDRYKGLLVPLECRHQRLETRVTRWGIDTLQWEYQCNAGETSDVTATIDLPPADGASYELNIKTGCYPNSDGAQEPRASAIDIEVQWCSDDENGWNRVLPREES